LAHHTKCTFDLATNGLACTLSDDIDDAFGFVFTIGVEWREELLLAGMDEDMLPMRRTIIRVVSMIKLDVSVPPNDADAYHQRHNG